MSRSHFLLALLVGSLGLCASARGGDVAGTSALGRKAENFTLNDFYGKPHSLADFKDKKIIVLAFVGTECPLAKLYAPRLTELQKKYADKGVQFLAINANRQDSITELAAYARVHKIDFPVLKDLNNKFADQIGAMRTPEVFVLDQDRMVRYHGKIDDQYGIGYVKKNTGETYLSNAIDELLAGKTVANGETVAVGCFIGKVHAGEGAAKVTYSNQVARILNKRCVECHRDGEIAPFALTSYESVSGWADTIAEVLRDRRMPPWLADPKFGHFSNDRSMPEDEKQAIYDWVAAGAPEGDPKELPEPPKFSEGWQLPNGPDKVYYMAEKPYKVQATGTVDYQYFVVDPGFKEDMWLKGIEARPGNRAIVHHIIVFSQPKGNRNEGARQFLVGYAPGAMPAMLPTGMAKFVPKNSELLFQLHYTPNGAPGEDRSKVGFIFANPKEVTHLLRTVEAINTGFRIPAGDDNYEVKADSFKYNFDVELVQLFPHMHLRGKQFSYQVKYPDGKTEMLLNVPRYDFGWQLTYELAQFKQLPKGTVVHCVAHFDNSENNLNNPNPKSEVRWGDQTWEEMMIGFFDVAVPVTQADLQAGKLPSFAPGPRDIAQRILTQFDKDGDGKISQKEIPIQPIQTKLFFVTLDTNKNGEITIDEIATFIETQQKKGRGRGGAGFGGRRYRQRDQQKTKSTDQDKSAEKKSDAAK